MGKTVRKLFITRRYREAYYQLTPGANESFWQKIGENETSVGAKFLIACDSRWCNEKYAGWGIIDYPDAQAVQKATAANEKNDLFRYVDTDTYLGQPVEDNQLFTGFESVKDTLDTIYQLFLIKNLSNDPWEGLSSYTRDLIWARVAESIANNGGKGVLWCQTDWSNEEYDGYGVIAWPNIEAQQSHFADLRKIGWHRYVYALTILGKKTNP